MRSRKKEGNKEGKEDTPTGKRKKERK